MKVMIVEDGAKPVKLVRVHKPRGGGGMTLGEFSNRDGRGVERALAYARKGRHVVVNHAEDRRAA